MDNNRAFGKNGRVIAYTSFMNRNVLRSVIAAFMLCLAFVARGQINLTCNPSTGVGTNYTVFWGTNSGIYVFSAAVGSATNLAVTGLQQDTVYYFAVDATGSDGSES